VRAIFPFFHLLFNVVVSPTVTQATGTLTFGQLYTFFSAKQNFIISI
jgi:hypothetical protein